MAKNMTAFWDAAPCNLEVADISEVLPASMIRATNNSRAKK
jgi:hypothetical protein